MAQKIGKKNKKGAVLVVSMLVLSMILIAALSLAAVAVQERKASIGEVRSGNAMQSAQTGAEIVLKNIADEIAANPPTENLVCCHDSGTYKGNIVYDGSCGGGDVYAFEVRLKDSDGDFDCDDSSYNVSDIDRIKSVGIGATEKRALEAVVIRP